MDNQLQILIDKSDLLEVLLKYCRAIDRRDYELLRTVYHPGAIDDHGVFFSGPAEEFIGLVPGFLEPYLITTHTILNALFSIDGDYAEGESYLLANHVKKENRSENWLVGGRYLDRFEKRSGGWKIIHRTCVVDWSNTGLDVDSGAVLGISGNSDKSYAQLPMLVSRLNSH